MKSLVSQSMIFVSPFNLSAPRLLSILAMGVLIVLNQNCANSSSTSGTAAALQSPVIIEALTEATPGQVLGLFDLTSVHSIEYRAPAMGLPKPGVRLDQVAIRATFNGSTLLPVKVSWEIVDFDHVLAECYSFINPLDVHPDYINVLLQKLAKTSLDRVRMPPGQTLTCLDCLTEARLIVTLDDTSTHSYVFDHQNLGSSPLTQIRDPQNSLESSMIAFLTHVNDATNPHSNQCQVP